MPELRKGRSWPRVATNIYNPLPSSKEADREVSIPAIALLSGSETIEVFAVLAFAIGLAGVAILILFAKKKI